MSNGKNPLVLMMALSVPGAAHALGLGDIHVDSALNERLAAEIDLVGTTALELTDLRAAVANREIFARYGADRPAFLSSATFKVTQDSQGRPVLAVRSTESFTEPVVNFLVDVQWRSGELVRQYTLLLDPAGFAAPAAPAVRAAPQLAAPQLVEPIAQTTAQIVAPSDSQPEQLNPPAAERARKTTHIKVGAKATLRGIAWRVGERSEADLQRMMLAIFRANPTAFDGNINRLHLGALLTIPSFAELAAISKAEAKREIRAQMAAWHAPARAAATSTASPAMPGPVAKTPATAAAESPADATISSTTVENTAVENTAVEKSPEGPAAEALDQRVQSLEQELREMKGLLDSEHDQLLGMQRQAARDEQPAPVVEAPREPSQSGHTAFGAIAAGLGVLAAAFAALYFKFRRRAPKVHDLRDLGDAVAAEPPAAEGGTDMAQDDAQEMEQEMEQDGAQERPAVPTPASAPDDAETDTDDTQPLLPVLPAAAPPGRSEIAAGAVARSAAHDPTVNMHVDTVNLRMDPTRLDYNFLDLDMTAQHVQMPSVLNEHAVVKERRTNLADVLKLAIEREPDRHDLRMKLLELYYSAAATNRQAFLEVVQKFARNREYLQVDQWEKIAYMGRQIAAESPLFGEESTADDDLADCA
jgi:pilus assembly protein FimV